MKTVTKPLTGESKMKKSLSILIMLCAMSFGTAVNNAHALSFGFVDLFTVNSVGSTTPQSVFGPGETPYLYMSLSIPEGAIASTVGGWNDPDGLDYFSFNPVNADTERWAFLPNWSSVEKAGTWTVNANYFDSHGNNMVASTNFTVTPEPATMSLLLMGGIPLFLKRKQRLSKI